MERGAPALRRCVSQMSLTKGAMAKLCAHGREIGRIEMLTKRKAYMADGVILMDRGCGWKVYGKVRPGVSPDQAYAAALNRQQEFDAARPGMSEFRRLLHQSALKHRWKILAAVQSMPNDADGVYSALMDEYDGPELDFAECVALCEAYRSIQNIAVVASSH